MGALRDPESWIYDGAWHRLVSDTAYLLTAMRLRALLLASTNHRLTPSGFQRDARDLGDVPSVSPLPADSPPERLRAHHLFL
jgi:hypothetical protein